MDIKDRLLDSLLSGMTLTAMGVRDVDGDGDLDQVWRVHNPYWANIKLQWGIVGSSETGFLKVHKESDSYFWTDADKGTATLSYRFANQTYWQITSATANSNPLNWNPFQNGDDSGSGSGGNPSNLPDLFTDERDTVFFDSTVKQENYRPGTSTYAALDGDDYVVLPTNDNWAYQAGIAFDAGDGDDFVKGGAKGDLLLGSLGNDSLLGEAGNDTLAGGDGFDVIRGGEGTDTAVFVGTLSDYSIQRIASTVYVKHGVTEEMDRVEEAELLQFGDRVYRIKDLPSYLPAGSNVSGINYSAPGGTGGDGPAQGALFTDYNEFVHLGDVAESDYKPGTPTHAAGGGNDYVSFPNANNWAYTAGKAFDAGAGDDIINGGANGDWILGNTGNDVLSGGGGNDTLDGGDGVDVLRGGEGTDTAVFVGTLSDYSIQRMGSSVWVKHGVTEEMDRVEEAELLQFGDRVYRIKDLPSYLPAGSNVSGINYSAPGGTGGDGPAQGALFTDYNEIVHLGVVAESDYKPGTPTHAAGGGNDYVTLPDTDNWAYTAGKAFDAGAGDDVVIGGASGDWIVGGSGNDVLSSGGGGDTLDGGGGYDTAVFKKPFSDYVFSRDGNRIVLDDGIQKSYLIDVEAVWLGDDFTYTSDLPFTDGGDGGGDGGGGGGTDPTALYTEGADILNLGNLRQEDHPGVVPAQNALGGNDQITLPSANNWAYTAGKVFDAGAGSDSITGGANGDWIVGNTGNDTLVGNGGNDTLAGGAGSDSLNGGDGIDTAVFDGAITDYIVRRTGGQITVAKYDGTETDRLSGIETLKFGDKTYQVSDLRTPRGDFNGDGRADVLWRDGRTNALSIWDLNGSKIAAARDVSVQETGVALPGASWAVEATVDFTGDGRADVLWRNGTSGQLALWEMNGHTVVSGANTGMVKLNGTDAAPGLAWKVESTADFTGDGKADILWRNSTSNQMLLWAMNGGTVTATAAVQLNGTAVAPAQAWKVEGAADFTGDGKADILWRNGTSNQVLLWTMDGGTVTSASTVEVNGAAAAPAQTWKVEGTADFTGDGKADILWRNGTSNQVLMWAMNGASAVSGANTGAVTYTGLGTANVSGLRVEGVADASGDGKADVLWRNPTSGQLTLWRLNGTAVASDTALQLNGAAATVSSAWSVQALADLTGDGKADVLWRNPTSGALTVWALDGNTVTSAASVQLNGANVAPGTAWQVEAVGDFTGDGKADLVWRNGTSNQVLLWAMNGATVTSSNAVQLNGAAVAPGAAWQVEGTGDFTGDGKADLVWRNTSSGQMLVWAMNGATVTSSNAVQLNGANVAPGTAWAVESVADLSGDGKADILWRNGGTGQLLLWEMNGSTVSASNVVQLNGAAATITAASGWTVAQARDFNGDGKADILWRNTATGQVSLWTMDGRTATSTGLVEQSNVAVSVEASSEVLGTQDYTGDGKADVLWRNTTTGQVSLWTMEGASIQSKSLVEANSGNAVMATNWRSVG